MRPFVFERADTPSSATAVFAQAPTDTGNRSVDATGRAQQFLAGGTTLLDLMKLDVMRPQIVVDINALGQTPLGTVQANERGLRLGALVRMAEAEGHPEIRRDYPVIAQSLGVAASAQLRNMASLGGNVLQRTRCPYFRDVSYSACNKRNPGSGCAARGGFNRMHAVLGTSNSCIATYPGDFAQALIALDASVDLDGPTGSRTIKFADLHRRPEERPDMETTLKPGELIRAFLVPSGPWTRRSLYLKIRDRRSYEFALASAAVALDLADGQVRQARIALGGVATVPWRAHKAEDALRGNELNEQTAKAAADAAFEEAQAFTNNGFKIPLGKATLTRALLQAAAMEA
jgi:xanthine dehydrogenase YagS FAD-binding subunit